jgi:hypothetical protein
MPAATLTAVPATAVKRKQRDEDQGSDDEGSDVVSFYLCLRDPQLIRSLEHGQRRFRLLQPEPRSRRVSPSQRIPNHTDVSHSIALKRLLRQLLSSDAKEFDIHALAQLVLSQAVQMGIGSTVKVDGTESDPYAYLSLVDLNGCSVSLLGRGVLQS